MNLAKWLIICGIGLIGLGVLVWLGLPLGRLPGDFRFKGGKTTFYFPLATGLLISLIITLLLNLIWIIRR